MKRGARMAVLTAAAAVVVLPLAACGSGDGGEPGSGSGEGLASGPIDIWYSTNPDLELAGVVLNRVPPVSSEADRRIAELARIVGHQAIWSPAIPQRVILNQAIGERRPIHSYGTRAHEPMLVFDSLWRRVRGLTER